MAVRNRRCTCCRVGADWLAARGRRRGRPPLATRRRCAQHRRCGRDPAAARRAGGMRRTARRRRGRCRALTSGGPGRGPRRAPRRRVRRRRQSSVGRSWPPSVTPWTARATAAARGCLGLHRRWAARRRDRRRWLLALAAACRPCLSLGSPLGRPGHLWASTWAVARRAVCPRLVWVAAAAWAGLGTPCTASLRCMAAAGHRHWRQVWWPPPWDLCQWAGHRGRQLSRPRRPRPGGTSGGT